MEYPWLKIPYQQLVEYYTIGRAHHALLLHTAAGNGVDRLVDELSRWLLCKQTKCDKSCGECHNCRLMLAGNHPDYHLLVAEKNKHSIGIELIRQVIERLYSYAQQGGAKVIWLSQVELLTEAGVNALLKILEEPPEKTYFLLGCREPSVLLATLRSRCLYWHLVRPNEQMSMQWLNRHTEGDPVEYLTALRLSGGAPIAAEQLLKAECWQHRSALCSVLFAALKQGDMLSLLPVLSQLDVGESLHWLSALLVDAMKWQQGALRYVVNQDQQALVYQLASRYSSMSLTQIVQKWLICRYQLLSVVGLNRELLLTEQLLSWEKH
ncbi:DNA polymerase III subunit delta' [Serratia symbiotica]|nr:DNA polymerase III subunit delta' [Serratia symbiotica]